MAAELKLAFIYTVETKGKLGRADKGWIQEEWAVPLTSSEEQELCPWVL